MDEYRKIPELGRENWERWFRLVRYKLISKKVYYTVEQSREEFAWVPKVDALKISELSTSKEIDSLSNSFKKLGGIWNIEKASQFDVNEASALFNISQFLNGDDESSLDEYPTAKKIWKYLMEKYSKTNETTANSYMTKIQTFKYDEEKGIDGCWEKLKELRRKLVSVDVNLKNTYPDQALYLILTQNLPPEFKATKDGLRLHKIMSIEDKLKELTEVEIEGKKDENALAAVTGQVFNGRRTLTIPQNVYILLWLLKTT